MGKLQMKRKDNSVRLALLLFLILILYLVGAVFVPSINMHEEMSLIKIKGIGKVLTYKDLYLSSATLFIPLSFIGALLYDGDLYGNRGSINAIKSVVFGNYIIGIGLIALSTKEHIISSVFFWLGIVAASFFVYLGEKK